MVDSLARCFLQVFLSINIGLDMQKILSSEFLISKAYVASHSFDNYENFFKNYHMSKSTYILDKIRLEQL